MDLFRQFKTDLTCPEACRTQKLKCVALILFSVSSLATIVYLFSIVITAALHIFGIPAALATVIAIGLFQNAVHKKTS